MTLYSAPSAPPRLILFLGEESLQKDAGIKRKPEFAKKLKEIFFR